MRFRLPDGHEITGRSYRDIVAAMSSEKLETPRTIASYRKATARRAREKYGAEVFPDDDRSFVLSLVSEGLLEIVN